jgi:tetratricopeptide (TPR) repeat protein
MTSNSPQPPELDRVEKSIKALTDLTSGLTGLLRLVAGMIRKRQWVDLLMFAIAVSIIFIGTKFTLAQFVKEPIFYGIWMGLGVIFLVGLVLELRKKPALKTISRDAGKRKAIKFLSSFEQEDAEIYGRLQGYRDLGLILETIILPDFSFGVLKGRSGCGKSFYLKAGLLAALAKTEAYRGVYIKFSNLDPLATIREALVDSLKLPKVEVESLGLLELLNKGVEVASEGSPNFKSLILIFDQFEQFFVYTDDAERRSGFIQALASWYGNDALKEKVKILVSIREDWFARMDEIQAVLNYTLRIGGQTGGNSFYLKNFSAEEATMILGVMAQEDLGIEAKDTVRFDHDYMQDTLERELVSPTDQLISPIDLQIVAETIKQQNTAEMRSFNRTALQKLGGIEGLRRSFLEGILEPLGTERQKSAVQVLVALTNLEQQTCAEVQTLAQLQQRVKGAVQPQEVVKIADYLQGTALISVVERDGIKGYELSHEGMIAAVIRMGEKVQDKVYRANQLLERRVNEWLGNNRSSRYLFSLGELWFLQQQRPYLVWGVKRQQKVQLIAKSKQRIYWAFGGVGFFLLLVMGGWGWWNHTSWGQLTQIRWKLAIVSQQINAPDSKSQAAVAFAKDGSFGESSKLVYQIQGSSEKQTTSRIIAEVYNKLNHLEKAIASASQIQDSNSKAIALSTTAEAYGKLNQQEKAAPLLEKAIASASQIQDSTEKATALGNIAETIGKLNQREKVTPLLEKVIASANQIKAPSKNYALRSIAEAYGKLNQQEKAAPLLENTITTANKIQDSFYKATALVRIAETMGKLNQQEKAAPLLEKAAPLLEKAITSAEKISDAFDKFGAFTTISETYFKLNQPEKAFSLLEKAIATSDKIQNSNRKVFVLGNIAETLVKLNQPRKAFPLLEKAIVVANKMEGSTEEKSRAFEAISGAYGKLNQSGKAFALLEKAIITSNQIQDSIYKTSALKANSAAIVKLNQPKKAVRLLEKVIISADKLQKSSDKVDVLSSVAKAYIKLNLSGKAALLIEQAISTFDKIHNVQDSSLSDYGIDSALSSIVEAIGKLNQPKKAVPLLNKSIASANKIQNSSNKSAFLIATAEAEANLGDWGQALKITQQCPSKDCEVESLTKVLTVYAELKHPELKKEEEK